LCWATAIDDLTPAPSPFAERGVGRAGHTPDKRLYGFDREHQHESRQHHNIARTIPLSVCGEGVRGEVSLQTQSALGKTLDLLDQLEKLRDALMVQISIPGEHWEIELFDDGHVEIERFISDGHISDEAILENLLNEYAIESGQS
jgi:hypothetical protein